MANKERYATSGRELAATFLALADAVAGWRNTFFDRGYDDEGTDPIVDGDVASLNITAAIMPITSAAADALDTYMTANRAYLSRMRSDL